MTDWASDIKATNEVFSKHFKARDFKALSNLYTKDCVLMPPGAKMVTGREAAIAVFTALPGLGVDSLAVTSHEVIANQNETATERGVIVLRKADGSIFDVGKSVVIWKREDGQAKLYTDIWNSDSA